ncbi:hypothetical protein [Photorhabdus akhurstii]|uniref:hypothetical protein n=1 Tax=Photorhabdus akhurstii TaxID=171438 RepID=UPI001BD25174|nr:hypothetical protein [Photorhabdus akhurstii]MBS9426647.1 hypothetical protein [Photorhabdus akhurstii]
MDFILSRDRNRNSEYYSTMGSLAARSVNESALSSSKSIKDNILRMKFQNEVKSFTHHQIEIINSSSSDSLKQQKVASEDKANHPRSFIPEVTF